MIAMKSPSPRLALAALLLAVAAGAHASPTIFDTVSSFNAVTFGNYTASQGTTTGAIGVGGNATLSGFTVNTDKTSGYDGYTLVVNGNLTFTNGTVNGSTALAGKQTTGPTFNGAVTQIDTFDKAVSAAQSDAIGYASQLAGLTATGKTANQYGGTQFTGDNTSDLTVFNISASDLTSTAWRTMSDVKAGSTVLFNVSGSKAALTTISGLDSFAGRVLFNFYEAQTLSISNLTVAANILAPDAAVTASNARVNGTVVMDDFYGSGFSFGTQAFTGRLPGVVSVSAVPEPQTWALMLAGLFSVVMLSRRRKARI
ncbi:MAG: hypothetical protein JWP52_2805 [Rhizobacter sp.]|nr:hypothetical protein [Rhizobacter sp.]